MGQCSHDIIPMRVIAPIVSMVSMLTDLLPASFDKEKETLSINKKDNHMLISEAGWDDLAIMPCE